MNVTRPAVDARMVGRLLAAVVVGLGVGTLVSPDPVAVPVVGSVPGPTAGVLALVLGGLLYVGVGRLGGGSDCGCSGDCGCS